jgi:hypothetical protein
MANFPANEGAGVELERGTKTSFSFFDAVPVSSDVTPPVISNVSPTSPSEIARFQPVTLDATDETGFRVIVLVAEFSDGTYEVVHDGTKFADRYAGGSTRDPITNGYRYVLRRRDGWLPGIRITPIAIDTSGNENL